MDAPAQRRSDVLAESVLVPTQYGYYGDINGKSPNTMYKKYLTWFAKNNEPNKKPLNFKNWLVWAHSKGMVMKASGPEIAETQEIKEAAKGAGKQIAIAVAIAIGIGLLINANRQRKI